MVAANGQKKPMGPKANSHDKIIYSVLMND